MLLSGLTIESNRDKLAEASLLHGGRTAHGRLSYGNPADCATRSAAWTAATRRAVRQLLGVGAGHFQANLQAQTQVPGTLLAQKKPLPKLGGAFNRLQVLCCLCLAPDQSPSGNRLPNNDREQDNQEAKEDQAGSHVVLSTLRIYSSHHKTCGASITG